MRFFSPPEKPTLTRALEQLSVDPDQLRLARARASRNSTASISGLAARACARALSAVRRKYMLPTPGISTGYWKARNTPAARPLLRRHREQVPAVEEHLALGHLVALAAGQHVGERALARAVRPHDRMHLAGADLEVDARAGSPCRRPTTCSMSSDLRVIAVSSRFRFDCASADAAFEADRRAASAPRPRTPSAAPGTPPCRSR